MTPRTGWRRPSPPGGTRSGSSRSTCAPSTPPRCAGCCRARSWCRTCSTSSTWRSRWGRAPPGGARQARPPRPVRRSRVRRHGPAGAQPGAPVTGTVRQGHGRPGPRSGRAGDRRGPVRQGETPPRPEPPASPARSCASATSAAGSLPPTTGARRTTTSPSCCPWPGRYPGRKRNRRRAPDRNHEFPFPKA